MSILKLFIFSTILITISNPSLAFTEKRVKVSGAPMKYKLPKGWKQRKIASNIYLHGPKGYKGYSPVLLISPIKTNNINYSVRALNKTKSLYYLGRKLFLKKENEKLVGKIPLTYQVKKNKKWHEIGYFAKGRGYVREEVSRYMYCNKNNFLIKSLVYNKNKTHMNRLLKNIRNSVNCI